MKKFVAAIAILIVLIILVIDSCHSNLPPFFEDDDSIFEGCDVSSVMEAKDPNVDPTNYDLEPEPAWKYGRIDWSNHRSTAILPLPDWTWWAYAIRDTDLAYRGYLGYSDFDNFEQYIKELQKAGFTENCETRETSSSVDWIGENADNGYAVMLHYCSWSPYITIWCYHDAEGLRTTFWKE